MTLIPSQYALAIAALAVLSGCCGKTVSPAPEAGHIKEVSFQGAHEDRRCTKGCRFVFVPDTWFLNVCADDSKACSVMEITHAPWSWQHEGAAVKMFWRHSSCTWWLDKIEAAA